MGCIALVRCVLVLRCGLAGVVWYPDTTIKMMHGPINVRSEGFLKLGDETSKSAGTWKIGGEAL